MSYHGKQYATVEKICACGCGQKFYPVPKYRPKSEGGGKWFPEYIRGHHPKIRQALQETVPWNKGLTKEHPTVARICFQKWHPVYNDWSTVNRMLKEDPAFKTKWIESKQGISPWNKGMTKDDYPEGVRPYPQARRSVSGFLLELIKETYERDNYTCQGCGKEAGPSKRKIRLHAHHIAPVKIRPDLIIEPSNLITLCPKCHVWAHIGKLPHLIKTE